MDRNKAIITQSVRELDRLKARDMTTTQLETNVRTYPAGGYNDTWRSACVAEIAYRAGKAEGFAVGAHWAARTQLQAVTVLAACQSGDVSVVNMPAVSGSEAFVTGYEDGFWDAVQTEAQDRIDKDAAILAALDRWLVSQGQ